MYIYIYIYIYIHIFIFLYKHKYSCIQRYYEIDIHIQLKRLACARADTHPVTPGRCTFLTTSKCGTSLIRNADLMPTIFVGGRAEHDWCWEGGGVRFCRAESPTTGVPRS